MNNSTNGSEIRKYTPFRDNLVTRNRHSSVKRRINYQNKIVKPLNFDEIRKEIEEAEKYENTRSGYGTASVTTSSSDIPEDTLKDITNRDRISPIEVSINKHENIPMPKKKNDSFELNLSALSISTSIKTNTCLNTAISNQLQICKESVVTKFEDFVIPKVKVFPPKSNYHNSENNVPMKIVDTKIIGENESFAHEIVSQHKEKKDIRDVICSIPQNIPEDKTFQKIIVKNVKYLVLNLLGRGGSSEVYQCFCQENKQLVAIKCVSLENSAAAVGYLNEVKLLQQLQDSDKIVKMYDYEILATEKKLLVVLEKCGDDLRTVLKQLALQQQHIPIYKLMFYWMEMLYAVKQIHAHGIIHSDLKPANFLNTSNGFLKLIDFGIASSVQGDMTSVMKVNLEGSWNYISPEALNNDSSSNPSSPNYGRAKYKIHYKSDVWSLGCILYQLVYRRTPFQHITRMGTKLAYILNPNHEIGYPDADWLPPNIMQAMKRCLRYDVKLRPSVDELIAEFESF